MLTNYNTKEMKRREVHRDTLSCPSCGTKQFTCLDYVIVPATFMCIKCTKVFEVK